MLLTRPDRTERWRVAVFIGVVGVHLLAGLLMLAANKVRIAVSWPEQGVIVTFLRSAELRPLPSVLSTSQVPANFSNPKKRESSTPADGKPVAEPDNAITVPYIDWGAEAEVGAKRKVDNDEAERRRRNLAGPSDSQLDWARNNAAIVGEHHKLGDGERAEGGEAITWENDKCYWTTHGVTIYGMPQTSKVCKDPPKADAELFKEMRKKLDERDTGRTP
jgi:hypothetical protein